MPLYEYRCDDCGEFEALRPLSEYNVPMNCPDCDTVAIKIFSVPNINLNSGSLSAIAKRTNSEPRLVKQEPMGQLCSFTLKDQVFYIVNL